MARKVFYSFHYKPDNWRASQVRNIGVLEGNEPTSDNGWETITKGGDAAIQKWIDSQMSGRPCAVVLIGTDTANRKWINYEIIKAWNDKKGVFGIYVHYLMDSQKRQSLKGSNPFDFITFGPSGPKLSTVVKVYEPPFLDSTQVYAYIQKNIGNWVETAIAQRALH